MTDLSGDELVLAHAIDRNWSPPPTWGACTEAVELLAELREHGWELTSIVTEPLPSVAPSRGPRTSDTAAASIDDLSDRQWAVFCFLSERGPCTDEGMVDGYGMWAGPDQSPSSLRTRRKELERAGHVAFTGVYGTTRSGRSAMTWAAVSR